MPEWLIGADCKSAALRATQVRILPPPPQIKFGLYGKKLYNRNSAHIAQSVEHVLGKNGVTSSNLVVGLDKEGGLKWQKRNLNELSRIVT